MHQQFRKGRLRKQSQEFYIYKKILLERTDEENPLSTTQLINILNDEYGMSAHRTTVTKDIAALQEFGMDIVTIHSS